jgi:hypothetical protein
LSKCEALQELISTQIPWASEGVERSRNDREMNAEGNRHVEQQTIEEKLLHALLDANEALLGVLNMYDDIMQASQEHVDLINDMEMNRRVSFSSSLRQGHFVFLAFSVISLLRSLSFLPCTS